MLLHLLTAGSGRLCCKSRFVLLIKNSAGRGFDFRVPWAIPSSLASSIDQPIDFGFPCFTSHKSPATRRPLSVKLIAIRPIAM